MAWSKKTWVQRIVENVGRRLLTPTTDANVFDITRNEGTIIQAGDGFTVSNMNNLENRIDSGFTDASTATGAVNTKVGVLASLTTAIKTNIVSAINEIVANIGTLSSLTTNVKTSIVNAINSLVTAINSITTSIGTLSSLTTTDKSSVVNAINGLQAIYSVTVSASSGHITVPSNQVIYSVQNSSATVSNDAVTSWQRISTTQIYYNKSGTASTKFIIVYKP